MHEETKHTVDGILAGHPWLTYLWVVGIAAWGGIVSYIAKVRRGITRRFSFTELIGEIVTSAFAGVLAFWLCEAAGGQPLLTAALVGISGHMGARAIFVMENTVEAWYSRRFQMAANKKETPP